MNGQNLTINGYRCRDRQEYEACLRDLDKISRLEKQLNENDFSSVEKIYSQLVSQSVKFETHFGWDFDDRINELYIQLKKNPQSNVYRKSSRNQIHHSKEKQTKNKAKSRPTNSLNQYPKTDFDHLDEEMKKQVLSELKKREARRKLFLILSVLAGVLCISLFVIHLYINVRNDSLKESLKNQKQESAYKPILHPDEPGSQTTEAVSEEAPDMLEKYEELYQKNQDLIGWIKIADTIIDYPVVQGEDNDFYLTHDFNGNYDRNGTIFLDFNCEIFPRSTNLILYGHHMKSGKMFAEIEKYASEKFYDTHKYIYFDTLYDEGVYEVMYVFRDRVYSQADVNFKYYEFYDAITEEEFNSYMKDMEERSYYDTGVKANFGDALLTLSTCDYQQTNGRFVVVAKRIYE